MYTSLITSENGEYLLPAYTLCFNWSFDKSMKSNKGGGVSK